MTQLIMSLVNSYIASKIYNLFGFSGGRQEDPKPLELFSTDIDTELFEGKYFAQYKTEPFYEPYVLSYFKDFNMMGLHFQKVAEKLPNADRKYDPNVLINEYEKHYNRFKSDIPPKYASPLSFNSFNKTSLEALGLLKDRAEKSVHPNSKYLACIIKSFETFLRKIDKKNTDKSWMPVSKLSFDLVNYLYFVQEKYGFSTVPQIIKILEIMSAVEVNSQSMLMKKSLEHEKVNFDNRADFDVYFQAALAIEKISTNLMRDLESTFSNRYANDLPLVHICNRFQCLMFILYMAADLPHSIEQSTEIKIRNTFLANLTGSFIHVLLSYFDLKHSMVSMIYYITMAHSKNLELLQAAYSALGLATKALQSSIFAATNHHGFDETELIYPGDVYGLVKEHFYNPIIEYMCTLFLQITTDRRPFSENLALVSDLSRVFSTLLGRKTEQTNFNDRLVDFAVKNFEQPLPKDKPIFEHFVESYVTSLMQDLENNTPRLRSVFSASKFSDEYVRVFEPDELFYKIDLGKIFSHAKEEKTGSNDEFLKKRQQQIHSNIRRLKICNTLFMSSAVVLVVIDSLALYTLYLKRSRNQGVTSM